jgi:uncharacterized protein (TIGR03084 family)
VRERLLADLAAESAALDDVLTGLTDAQWQLPTPAVGWTIAHQVAHLAWTDDVALLAVTDPAAFAAHVAGNSDDAGDAADRGAAAGAGDPSGLLRRWRASRQGLAAALAAAPDGARLPWFGPSMSVTSMATARLMETWAHGVDVRDALGLPIEESPRLDHVAHLGVRTRAYSFEVHGFPPPTAPIRLELTRADGSRWTDGPDRAEQRVSGGMLDFCLRVVQRRPRSALSLVAVGADADRWLDIAQAYA